MNVLTDYPRGTHVDHAVLLKHDGTLRTRDVPAPCHRLRFSRRKRGRLVRSEFFLEHQRGPYGTIDRAR